MHAQQLCSETRDVDFILYELPESSLHVTCGCVKSSIVLYSNVFITEVGLKSSSGSHLGVIKTIWLSKLLKFQTYFSKSCYKSFTILLVSLYVIWVDHWRLESMQWDKIQNFVPDTPSLCDYIWSYVELFMQLCK